MSAQPLNCPYCNAIISPSPGLVVGQKMPCPRCGEAFTVTHAPIPDSTPSLTPPPPPEKDYRKPLRANRLLGGTILGVMLLMAGIGLAYALATVGTRREHDRALPRQQRKPWLLGDQGNDAEPNVSPASLAGLGYLPASTGMVAALHMEELLNSPAGKELSSRSLKIGNRDISLSVLKEWTGLAADDIDHVVVGVDVRNLDVPDLTPPVHIVVRTKRSDGANRIRVALKARGGKVEKSPDGETRTLFTAQIGDLPVRLWVADNRTVVIGVFSLLDKVPAKPSEGLAQMPLPLREAIDQRLAAGVVLWVAGHSDNWKNTWLPTALGQLKSVPLGSRLDQAQTFVLGVVPSRPVKLAGAFCFANEATARKIMQSDLHPRQKANPDTFKFSQAGPWLDIQQTLELPREK